MAKPVRRKRQEKRETRASIVGRGEGALMFGIPEVLIQTVVLASRLESKTSW